ncbi:MAG: methyltransferase type 12 [Acidimicrobiaceae bacterium]|nr:methyltransferase type 12 [Acidimicrobiaceae bacterium]
MTTSGRDPIESFYDAHPYPPPVGDLDAIASRSSTGPDRVAHHLVWPDRSPDEIRSMLVAGCGTAQAARQALRHPHLDVVGIDVSATAIEHTRRLIEQHEITNLSVERMAIEDVASLDRRFDHVVCTGVLHHLADPPAGLRALRAALAPHGAVTLMVYAPFGRTGIYLLQEYCRRLGVTTDRDDIAALVATLGELPNDHPLSRLLRTSPDFQHDDALADALLNPRDRAYSVPELMELLTDAGLRFGRWERQAPYLPDCGSISETPHAARITQLSPAEQYAAVELFRGTIERHTVIAFADDDTRSGSVPFDTPERLVPITIPTVIAVDDPDRLPPGAAAALLNRAHTFTDLVLFVDRAELETVRSIDGVRTVADLGAGAVNLVERLWRHDLVVLDATGAAAGEGG